MSRGATDDAVQVICLLLLGILFGYAGGRLHADAEDKAKAVRSELSALRMRLYQVEHPEEVPA